MSFQNPRWEYTSREHAKGAAELDEATLKAKGWERAWADHTLDGVYVVYRRDKLSLEALQETAIAAQARHIAVRTFGTNAPEAVLQEMARDPGIIQAAKTELGFVSEEEILASLK